MQLDSALEISRQLEALADDRPEHTPTAIHEAGHILTARLFCRRIIMVTVDPCEDVRGCMWMWPNESAPELMRQSLIILAAGSAATQRFSGGGEMIDGDDHRQMLETAWKLVGRLRTLREVNREIDQALSRARVLVDRYRPEIKRIAVGLLGHYLFLEGIGPFTEALTTLDERKPDALPDRIQCVA